MTYALFLQLIYTDYDQNLEANDGNLMAALNRTVRELPGTHEKTPYTLLLNTRHLEDYFIPCFLQLIFASSVVCD
jgi:hypothetical protein